MLLAEKVLILTADSRILVGTLVACDQSTNLVRQPACLLSFELQMDKFTLGDVKTDRNLTTLPRF